MAFGIVATQGVVGTGGSGSSIFLADVSNVSATAGSKKITLKWTDPEDVTLNEVTLSAWSGTIVVRKEGSAPTSRTDGTVVLTSTSRNAYSTSGWVDNNLENGKTYHYRFFPYNIDGNYTEGTSISAKPAATTVAIPTITSTHTYSGSAQTPTISGFDENTMTKTGDLTKTDAGNYEITVSLKDDDHIWNDGTYTDKKLPWTMKPESLTVPTVSGSLTYNTKAQSPTLTNYVDAKMTKTGDTSKTDAGNYTITVGLASTNYVFSGKDASVRSVNLPWLIGKATGKVTLSKSTTTLSASKTSDTATITKTGDGTLSVESSNQSLVAGTINGTTLTVTKAGNVNGTVTITVKTSATTNYTAASAQISVTVQTYKTMTVKIDTSNSNPETCCTYADDATSMTAGSDAWDTFFGHYPCLFAGGSEGVKLNPNNFDKDINGNSVTINSGNNDVMIAFPKRGLKITTSNNIITISMTDNPNDSNFKYYAHTRGTTVKDKFYLGAYMGSEVSSKLRSLKGQTIANNKTHEAFRNLAQANGKPNGNGGSGYDQHGFYQLVYLQAMYCLKYKHLNSQTQVGVGYSSASAQLATGGTETWGMDKKNGTVSSATEHMKIFGLEDLWANVWSWIDGFWCDGSRNIYTATQNFNSNGSGYTNQGQAATADQGWNWLTKVMGTTEAGFTPVSTSGGSETTFWCDGSRLYASRLLIFGGGWYHGTYCGVFCSDVYHGASYAYAEVGSRLMYL